MKACNTIIILALAAFSAIEANAQKLPKREAILQAMELANDYFITQHPDAGAPTYVNRMRPSNLWTRGVYFEGLSALIDIEEQTGSAEYESNLKYINDWGTAHQWTPRNGTKTRNADDYCCSQTYIWWYEKHADKDISTLNPSIECMNNTIATPESLHDWTWIDAIQMGLPVLTGLSRIEATVNFNDDYARFAEQGWKMYTWTRDTLAGGLFNKEEGLWWRDKDFIPPYKEPNGRNCYWSRGNGWVYAALVRAMKDIEAIPEYNNHFDEYKADYMKMTTALLACQREDFFWNASLHDESDFGGKELTGTSLFTYGLAWGVNQGWITDKKVKKTIISTWNALVADCLHSNGFLGFVQGTGKQPSDSQPVTYDSQPDFDDFGLGCFLLAGSEIYKMAK